MTVLQKLLPSLGISDTPSENAKYLRVILKALRIVAEDLPGVGTVIKLTEVLEDLSQEEDDEKLEKRVEELLSLGTQTNDKLDALFALSQFMFVRQAQIFDQLQAHSIQTTPKQLNAFAVETALVAYRGCIAKTYLYSDYRGVNAISREEHAASFELDEVYVLPRFLADRDFKRAHEHEEKLMRKLVDAQDLLPEETTRLEKEYAELTGKRWDANRKEPEHGLSLSEVLKQHQRMVIIGSPGVGKSALTRFLARQFALGPEALQKWLGWSEDLIPIVLPLAAFADARNRKSDLELREFVIEYALKRVNQANGDVLQPALEEALAQGNLFILFDGIDEIPTAAARACIVQQVDDFIAAYQENRFVVTSRPYGYTRLRGDIPHFQMPNFSSEQVKTFIGHWQRAFERKHHPQAPDLKKAEAEAEAMFAEIEGSPKVMELATNPLMLVIISLIRYEGGKLPEKRVELYNRAVNTLMETWNVWRSQLGREVGGVKLPLERLVPVWAAVAHWRRTQPTGIIHRAELKRKLIEILKEKDFDDDRPEDTVESYLEAAADRSGILEERGKNIFAFWHPTFEEFLAAVHLTTPTSKAIDRILPLRHDPRWHEVIRLAVGYVGIILRDRETATAMVEAIASQGNDLKEQVLHTNLWLAATCAADDPNIKRTLSQELVVRLADILREKPFNRLGNGFVRIIRALPRVHPTDETVAALASLSDFPGWQVRMESARWLSNVTAKNAEAHRLCEQLLADSEMNVRSHAALGLARTGNYRPEIWADLLSFNNEDALIRLFIEEFTIGLSAEGMRSLVSCLTAESYDLRLQAASLLIELDRTDERVLTALGSCLTAESVDPRFVGHWRLFKLGQTDEAVLTTLRSWLTAGPDSLRLEAARLLVRLGRADEPVLTALGSCVTAESEYLRLEAAELLVELGRADERVLKVLRSGLTAKSDELRFMSARLLIGLDHIDELVLTVVRSTLIAGSMVLDFRASRLLIDLAHINQEFLTTLRSWLTIELADLPFQAARLLVKLGHTDQTVLNAIHSGLTAKSANVCIQAASLLVELGQTDEAMFTALRSWLTAESEKLRHEAIRLLVSFGRTDKAVLTTLHSLLTAESVNLRIEAARLLTKLDYTSSEAVLTALRSCLTAESEYLRFQAARLLVELNHADEAVLSVLRSWLTAESEYLRSQAARLLVELEQTEAIVETMVDLTSPETPSLVLVCQRVANYECLSDMDYAALDGMIRIGADDTEAQKQAKAWLFDWLWKNFESQPRN